MNSTGDTEVAKLYAGSADINLWVEDLLTRDYLRTAWSNPIDVAFWVAGRSDAIEPVLHHAVAGKQKNVFGLIDRDFAATNYAHWTVAGKSFRRFVLPVHELENVLLDSDALAACNLNTHLRSAGDIEARLRAVAREQRWWMACRRVIAEIRERFFADFLSHPGLNDITAKGAAEKYVLKSDWFMQLKARTSLTTQAKVKQRLVEAFQWCEAQLKGSSD